MQMLSSLLDTVPSMVKGFLYMSTAVMGHCMMHSTQMMTSKQDYHGMLEFE